MAAEGVAGDAPAALALALAGRLGADVEQEQVQGAAPAPGFAGQPGAHPRLGAAVVHDEPLPGAQGPAQSGVVGEADQGAVERVRQEAGDAGLPAVPGVLGVDAAAGDRAVHQGGFAAAGQAGDDDHVPGPEEEGVRAAAGPVAQIADDRRGAVRAALADRRGGLSRHRQAGVGGVGRGPVHRDRPPEGSVNPLPVLCKGKVMEKGRRFVCVRPQVGHSRRVWMAGVWRAMMSPPTAYRPFESARESSRAPSGPPGAPKEQVPPLNLSGPVTARARHI